MTTEIKSQANRKLEIGKLEARCEKAEAVMKDLRLTLCQMHEKQINRLAELRCQRLLLKTAERAQGFCSNPPPAPRSIYPFTPGIEPDPV